MLEEVVVPRPEETRMPAAHTAALPARAVVQEPQAASAHPTPAAQEPKVVAEAAVPLLLPGLAHRAAPSRKSRA